MAKKTIKVTLIKSPIGTKADHRATLRGLPTWFVPSN